MADLKGAIGKHVVVEYRARGGTFRGQTVPVYGHTQFVVRDAAAPLLASFEGTAVGVDSNHLYLEMPGGRVVAIMVAAISRVVEKG